MYLYANPFAALAKKILGTQNDRELKSIRPIVSQINAFEPAIQKLSDAALAAKTVEFKNKIAQGASLDAILPEAFAVVRDAWNRVLNMRHFDTQLVGGITLHRGRIAEMRTGEGKTLVATLPSYVNALSGKGVHVVTVNDYLARRDSEWMGRIHRFLGLSVGVIVHGINDRQRKEQYRCDITYGQNNEFGFDYLRDNMKFSLDDYVQRELNYALIDEVDSILIDEARTPLIISGPSDHSTDLYGKIDSKILAADLKKDTDYTVDEKSKTAVLTEAGVDKMEKLLGIENLYDPIHIETLHHVNQAVRAHIIYKRDVDYVVNEDNEVMIVDEFTGRLMPGRRWSDGLHQAIEAKEGVPIESENQTLATITFQNYFRMYGKLAGMTGTADTEATEFKQIYKLDVTVIPTNRPMVRKDMDDVIYKSEDAKFSAIAQQIKELKDKGQPTLVGTVSVEKSERISALLKRQGVAHHVLNAKQHAREADIVAQAGRKGSVTIATNMAGRGTDILLGGNPEVMAKADVGPPTKEEAASPEGLEAYTKRLEEASVKWKAKCAAERDEVLSLGGLFILGTERHESRRIDNQLRGRAGRQGDPGMSRFFLSLDDDLMRIFGGARIKGFMEDDLPIEHRWINKAIENAQRKVEAHNYDIRKHLLEYDDVMNQQRKVVYQWRREVLAQDHLRAMVFSMVDELAGVVAEDFFPGGKLPTVNGQKSLDTKELNDALAVMFSIPPYQGRGVQERDITPFNDKGLKALIVKMAQEAYDAKEAAFGDRNMRQIERMILLSTIDQLWKDHLLAMDHLREGIGLRGYAQKDPLVEYKKEGFRYFSMMMNQITSDVVRKIFAVQMAQGEHLREEFQQDQEMHMNITDSGELIQSRPEPKPAPRAPGPLPVRNVYQGAQVASRPQSGGIGGFQLNPQGPMGAGAAPGPVRPQAQPVVSGEAKVGRNDPCPCGSGKKYKKCHGS